MNEIKEYTSDVETNVRWRAEPFYTPLTRKGDEGIFSTSNARDRILRPSAVAIEKDRAGGQVETTTEERFIGRLVQALGGPSSGESPIAIMNEGPPHVERPDHFLGRVDGASVIALEGKRGYNRPEIGLAGAVRGSFLQDACVIENKFSEQDRNRINDPAVFVDYCLRVDRHLEKNPEECEEFLILVPLMKRLCEKIQFAAGERSDEARRAELAYHDSVGTVGRGPHIEVAGRGVHESTQTSPLNLAFEFINAPAWTPDEFFARFKKSLPFMSRKLLVAVTQAWLDEQVGKEYGSFEANQSMTSELKGCLKDLKKKVACGAEPSPSEEALQAPDGGGKVGSTPVNGNICAKPSSFSCFRDGSYQNGVFRFEHSGKEQVPHGRFTTIPPLTLCDPSPDRRFKINR